MNVLVRVVLLLNEMSCKKHVVHSFYLQYRFANDVFVQLKVDQDTIVYFENDKLARAKNISLRIIQYMKEWLRFFVRSEFFSHE